jgi:predicted MPP superfamily phosphohydrolase
MKIILFRILLALIFPIIDFLFYQFLINRHKKLNNKYFKISYWTFCILLYLNSLFFTIYRNYNFRLNFWEVFQVIVVIMILNYFLKFIYLLTELLFYPFSILKKKNACLRRLKYAKIITQIILTAVFTSIIFHGIFYGRFDFKLKVYELKFYNLPQEFNNYKIVHISDLHLESFRNNQDKLKESIDIINDLNPDIIVFTGDLVSNLTAEAFGFENILSQLNAKDGVFAVTGNHDYGTYVKWSDDKLKEQNFNQLKDFYSKINWNLLLNENIQIKRNTSKLVIAGIESSGKPPFGGNADINHALMNTREEDFVVLLSHDPSYWKLEILKYKNIMLTLSGHTHSMQIACCNNKYSPSALVYKEWYGEYMFENKFLIISNGLGTILMPLRIGAHPEIGLITLQCK